MKTSKTNFDDQTVVDKGNARIEVNINANDNTNEPKKKRGFKRGAVVGTLGGIFLGGAGAAYAIENEITMEDIEDGVNEIIAGAERGFNAAFNKAETTSNSEQATAEVTAEATAEVTAENLTSEDIIGAIHDTINGEESVADDTLTSEDIIGAIHDELNVEAEVEAEAGLNVLDGDFSEMSFDDAFAAAREAAGGSGGVFEWKGGLYGTFLADEWNEMSDDAKAEYGAQVREIVLEYEANDEPIEELVVEPDPIEEPVVEPDSIEEPVVEPDPIDEPIVEPYDDGSIDVNVIEGYNITDASGNETNISVLEVGDQGVEVVLIDQDGDGQFDAMVYDENQDGILDQSDVFEIQDENLMVEDINSLIDDTTEETMDMVDDVDFMA